MKSDPSAAKRLVKKACKVPDPCLHLSLPANALTSARGDPLTLEHKWATHLSPPMAEWVFGLFRSNMRDLYRMSQWGYDEHSKKQELEATTARFLILRTKEGEPVAYTHYRFTIDNDRPVLYCYEIQVDPSLQCAGLGSLLLSILEKIASKYSMMLVMATVFAFNGQSLAFFHKNGFRADETSPSEQKGLDYLILSKAIN